MHWKSPPLRVSIDLGSCATRMCAGDADAEEVRVFPSAFAPTSAPDTFVIGDEVFRRRLTPSVPVEAGVVAEQHCATFLRLLRSIAGHEDRPTWAVLSTPSSGRADQPEKLARVAGVAFDRVLVVPGLTLAALALKDTLAPEGGLTLVGIGHASIQVALLDKTMSEPQQIVYISGGGEALERRVAEEFRGLVPDIPINDRTLRNVRYKYARAGDNRHPCLVQVIQKGQRRIVDVGDAMARATAPLVDNIAAAILHVLGTIAGPAASAHGAHVVLTGGGALIPGIGDALRDKLRERHLPTDRVTIPAKPDELVMRGGFKVACMLTPQHWDVVA